LIVGASVALGWGVDRVEDTWWARLCRITGGQYINLSVPATRVADHLEVLREQSVRFDAVLAVVGANDLVLGLAPGVRGQVDVRARQFRRASAALESAGVVRVLQPIPQGYGEEVRRAYHEMAREVDLDLSALPVDYVDRIHFGRAGQASLARAIAEVM
jgi:lysophospholipase L1-like esterase